MLPTEAVVRIGFFAAVLGVIALWEVVAPKRLLTVAKPWRWSSNLALVGINGVLTRLILPLTAVGTAELAAQSGWGLFNAMDWHPWLTFGIALVVLDLALYLQHVMFHAVPTLWRLHLVHHADLDFDVTTGVRFHTLEILLSMLLKIGVVAALGPPPWSIVAFEVLLNATAMFNHGNIRIPEWLDRALRLVVVTPDMHRVHHSVVPSETNSNFGFNLPWWDYLLGTYRAQPAAGHEQMQIGVGHLRNEQEVDRLPGMLALPFRAGIRDHTLREETDLHRDQAKRSTLVG